MKLGISGIRLAIATVALSGCAGGLDASCELHVGESAPAPLYLAPGETELVLTPSRGMPAADTPPVQSFAGVLTHGSAR